MAVDGEYLATGLMLASGANIIAYNQLEGFGKLIFIGDDATLDNLGINNKLVYVED